MTALRFDEFYAFQRGLARRRTRMRSLGGLGASSPWLALEAQADVLEKQAAALGPSSPAAPSLLSQARTLRQQAHILRDQAGYSKSKEPGYASAGQLRPAEREAAQEPVPTRSIASASTSSAKVAEDVYKNALARGAAPETATFNAAYQGALAEGASHEEAVAVGKRAADAYRAGATDDSALSFGPQKTVIQPYQWQSTARDRKSLLPTESAVTAVTRTPLQMPALSTGSKITAGVALAIGLGGLILLGAIFSMRD